jgi:hypothetical protein
MPVTSGTHLKTLLQPSRGKCVDMLHVKTYTNRIPSNFHGCEAEYLVCMVSLAGANGKYVHEPELPPLCRKHA